MKNTRGKASPRGQTAPVETFTYVCFSHSERLLVANIVICFISGHSFFVTTPHYFDLSSYDYSRDFSDFSMDFSDFSRDFPDFSREILSDPRARVA